MRKLGSIVGDNVLITKIVFFGYVVGPVTPNELKVSVVISWFSC